MTWPLAALLAGMSAAPAVQITGLATDSRCVRPGDLFCALAGARGHGLQHLAQVVAQGAVAVAYEADIETVLPSDSPIPLYPVPNLRARLGELAARFYGYPAQRLSLLGVTGTNGKTSITQFLAQALGGGVIGTLGYGLPGQLQPTTHTTPDPLTLQQMLAALVPQVREVALEVSSHALVQQRVNGLDFEGAVFSNLTRDHLDYHGDMAAYAAAKQGLFTRPKLRWLVSNNDDACGQEILKLRPDLPRIAYGRNPVDLPGVLPLTLTEFQPLVEGGTRIGVISPWGAAHWTTPLLGYFNVQNSLAVLGALLLHGVAWETALARMAQLRPVLGRLECFGGVGALPLVVVDYAHTPDALQQALLALQPYVRGGQLCCVFGCGGERDAGKRPLMGAIAERYSQRVMLTDDNPRSESSATILAAILTGMRQPAAAQVIPDRHTAITTALSASGAGDVVLIAGKGHETTQILGTTVIPFSDQQVVQAFFQQQRIG